jgi:hypothetical protein
VISGLDTNTLLMPGEDLSSGSRFAQAMRVRSTFFDVFATV